MSGIVYLFCSSIGRKLLMAATGILLLGFAIAHLAGNLLIFREPDVINGYAQFLHALGPTLWLARLVLLLGAAIHIWAAVALALENIRARGPQPWKTTWLQATFQSRTMQLTGVVVLAFLFYHLAHFSFGMVQADSFKGSLAPHTMKADFHFMGFVAVREGERVPDVYSMIVRGFEPTVVSAFYLVAIGLLSLHVLHGIESSCQTFGVGNARFQRRVRVSGAVFCVTYFLGSVSIPAAVQLGILNLRPDG